MLCKYSGAYEAQNYAERDNKKIITIWQLRFSMLYYTQQTAWEWGNGVSPTWCDHQVHVKAISCRFKSCYLHQAKIIRTFSQLETGSDLSFSTLIRILIVRLADKHLWDLRYHLYRKHACFVSHIISILCIDYFVYKAVCVFSLILYKNIIIYLYIDFLVFSWKWLLFYYII